MISGKKILVIGGSKGLGAAIVERLEAHNQVAAAARTATKHPLDLNASAAEIDASVRAVIREMEGLDILVVSSGMAAYCPPLVSDSKVKELFQVNVFGPLVAFRACLPALLRSKGKAMVVTSSVSRRPGASGLAVYAATKGAMNSWIISEARRMAKKKVALFAYSPGFFDSPMTDELPTALRQKSESAIPYGRFGELPEVSAFAVSLLEQPNWVLTGQIFEATGGA